MTPTPSSRRARPARVVVAEDDPELRGLVARALGRAGFEVVQARDGQDALGVLREAAATGAPAPDVFVMDVRMPNTSGMDVLSRLRTEGHPQPVVLMTGFGDRELHESAAHEGAAVVLDKPFDLDELVEIVRLVSMRPIG